MIRSSPSNSSQRIFITGGCGFIGANIVKYLLDKSRYNIAVYDDLSSGSHENLKRAINDSLHKGKVKFIKGNISNYTELANAIKDNTIIIHLAAYTRVLESLKNPKKNFSINTIGTFNVLESARKNKIDKLIFASSNAAVGEQIPPINENIIPKPLSPYGATKLFGEALCSAYFHSYGLKTICLRFANAYGPYSEHKTSVIAKFVRRIKQGKSLEIYGDGHQTRDFIHALDICQAIHLCINPSIPNLGGEIFQIATGVETKIIDLAKTVRESAISSGEKHVGITFKSKRRGEIKKNYSDISKAKKILGFMPEMNLKNGIRNLINP